MVQWDQDSSHSPDLFFCKNFSSYKPRRSDVVVTSLWPNYTLKVFFTTSTVIPVLSAGEPDKTL